MCTTSIYAQDLSIQVPFWFVRNCRFCQDTVRSPAADGDEADCLNNWIGQGCTVCQSSACLLACTAQGGHGGCGAASGVVEASLRAGQATGPGMIPMPNDTICADYNDCCIECL